MQCADVRAREYMLTLAHGVQSIHCTVTICKYYCLYMFV